VELLLPVALVLAFKDQRNSKAYLIVAAALVASVIAAASRAGATIVIAELALAFVLRPRTEKQAVQRRWITFALLASAFTLIVGYQYLWDRFSNDPDPYGIRREFVESSLAMVHAQPLHGFGLGAWPAAYRQFAIIDTGLLANHAHNEWAQWAAEGGLPAFALMLAVLGLCLPAAVRSVWGIGVIAVFLHSLVDYPFMRLGLAAWTFVFIGALAAYGRERRSLEHGNAAPQRLPGAAARILAVALIPVLWFGIFQAAKLAWADTLYRRATPESVARAAEISPNQAEYHFALAQADPDRAVPHLNRALALNPYHTKARIALATEAEQRGDLAAGEAMLLEAARRDKQYAPAWAAANFYFRNDQPERFWQWARRAAEMSYGSLGSLFDLCFLLTNDAQTVLDRVVVPRRLVEREYLAYLIDHERLADAHLAALRIAPTGGDGDREILLNYVDRTLATSRFTNALEIWNQLCRRRLVPYPAAAAGTLVNGDFAQPILNRAFDWRLAAIDGAVAAQARAGGPGLDVAFSGKQPENCEIMSHFVPLAKGATYVLRFQYRTDDLPEETGLLWSVGAGSQRELPASQEWSAQQWQFQAPDDAARLVLEYRRRLGTTRIEGTLRIRQVQLTQETL
jgi:tetratricopeptide (TPR) repeat protein